MITKHSIGRLVAFCFAAPHSDKIVASAAGCSVRAAHYYGTGEKEMGAVKFARLMATSEEFEKRVLADVHAEREQMRAGTADRRNAGASAGLGGVAGGTGVAVAGAGAGSDAAVGGVRRVGERRR